MHFSYKIDSVLLRARDALRGLEIVMDDLELKHLLPCATSRKKGITVLTDCLLGHTPQEQASKALSVSAFISGMIYRLKAVQLITITDLYPEIHLPSTVSCTRPQLCWC